MSPLLFCCYYIILARTESLGLDGEAAHLDGVLGEGAADFAGAVGDGEGLAGANEGGGARVVKGDRRATALDAFGRRNEQIGRARVEDDVERLWSASQ